MTNPLSVGDRVWIRTGGLLKGATGVIAAPSTRHRNTWVVKLDRKPWWWRATVEVYDGALEKLHRESGD